MEIKFAGQIPRCTTYSDFGITLSDESWTFAVDEEQPPNPPNRCLIRVDRDQGARSRFRITSAGRLHPMRGWNGRLGAVAHCRSVASLGWVRSHSAQRLRPAAHGSRVSYSLISCHHLHPHSAHIARRADWFLQHAQRWPRSRTRSPAQMAEMGQSRWHLGSHSHCARS